ncbi:hypothetical protein T06_8320 [Trichinella sp. T6]|nr:hypothetical protein T06_8320 [Trichinella sp. T6]
MVGDVRLVRRVLWGGIGIENRVTNGDNFQTYSIHVPGLGYVFGGSECRIRHEANSQLKFWIAGMGASMQRYLKPNELQKPALYLHKEHGTVCTPPCLRKRSFVLQDGAPCWSLYPPHALNISSPTPGMSAISQKSFIPDFNSFIFITFHI